MRSKNSSLFSPTKNALYNRKITSVIYFMQAIFEKLLKRLYVTF